MNVHCLGVFAENRTVSDSPEGVTHVDVFQPRWRNDSFESLFAKVFPIRTLGDTSNIDEVGHAKTAHESDEAVEPTIPISCRVNLLPGRLLHSRDLTDGRSCTRDAADYLIPLMTMPFTKYR